MPSPHAPGQRGSHAQPLVRCREPAGPRGPRRPARAPGRTRRPPMEVWPIVDKPALASARSPVSRKAGLPARPPVPSSKGAVTTPSGGATIGTWAVSAFSSAGSGVRAVRWMNNGRRAPTTAPPVTRSCRRSDLGAGRCTSRGRCGCRRRHRSYWRSVRSTVIRHTTTAPRRCSPRARCLTLVMIGMPKESGKSGYAGDARGGWKRMADGRVSPALLRLDIMIRRADGGTAGRAVV